MIRAGMALLALALAGCEANDPYRARDLWQPAGANAGNLAAMAARPRDLIVGRGGRLTDGRLSADAVDRVWQDRAKPLTSAKGSAATTGNSGQGG
jgi:type IV pilus biogenesis protein CpaD/CtpE